MKNTLKLLVRLLMWCFIIGGVYVISILWRVSAAETELFGRSELIPMKWPQPKYGSHSPDKRSYASPVFTFKHNGQQILVWKEKINAFQHVYGSAIMAYETGSWFADRAFCINEHLEAHFDGNGITDRDFMDRRKDLAHNKVGQVIAEQAKVLIRQKKLKPMDTYGWLEKEILRKMANWEDIFPHHWDSRIKQLPDESAAGCPGLPDKSIRERLGIN